MIEKPYCKENYTACPCSRCQHDKDNCCGCAQFTTYTCPVRRCSEFKEKRPVRPPERTPEPARETGA